MQVTIIFQNREKNTKHGQEFNVESYEVHSSYNFLALIFADGRRQHFNLDNVFSFDVSTKKI